MHLVIDPCHPRWKTLALGCLALAVLALGGCGNGTNNPTPGGGATGLAGLVTNAVSTDPLDNYVEITITPVPTGAPIEFDAANDGTYARTLPAGNYRVDAWRPGYGTHTSGTINVPSGSTVTYDFTLPPLPSVTYIGYEACASCHEAITDLFVQSGHLYKLNRVTANDPPTYPFSDIAAALALIGDNDGDGQTDNTLGTPTAWNQMTYVIGGFGWKARFIDLAGWIVTGSDVQYNLFGSAGAGTDMVGYHDNEVDRPYNCGNCHTTGWRRFDGNVNPVRQDGLPGMDGTFFRGGVDCEACHGAGALHAQTQLATDITEVASPRQEADFLQPNQGYGLPVACGECHTRDGERDWSSYRSAFDSARLANNLPVLPQGGRIAWKGGLIRHHEQYDEVLGIDPDTLLSVRSGTFLSNHGDCSTCHDPHATTVYRNDPGYSGPSGVQDSNAFCMDCHQLYDPMLANTTLMTGLNCVDCHMPKISKSALSTGGVGDAPTTGDVTSHLFRINLAAGAPQTTASGSGSGFAYPYITRDWACRVCHTGEPGEPFSLPDVLIDSYEFHTNVGP